MNWQLPVGLGILVLGLVFLALMMSKKTATNEYLSAVAIAEMGTMFIVRSLVPAGAPQAGVMAVFMAAVASTYVMQVMMRRRQRAQPAQLTA